MSSESTFAYDDVLPALPVPTLEATKARFLKSCEPLLSPSQYAETKRLWEKFISAEGEGPTLQAALEARAANQRNWLEDWWNTFAYLSWREPSAINVNFCGPATYTFWPPNFNSQNERSAVLVHHTLLFWRQINRGELRPQKMAGQPLCMNQYRHIFAECRVPGVEVDEQHNYMAECPRHIVVIYQHRFFELECVDEQGYPYSVALIKSQLDRIVALAHALPAEPGVGALTSENRTTWAHAREELISVSARNEQNLLVVQKALFALVLDDALPKNNEEICQQTLTGNCRNRFFDKMYSVIVFKNGENGLNGEHSPADAMVCVHCTNFVRESVFKSIKSGRKDLDTCNEAQLSRQSGRAPSHLAFELSPKTRASIELAVQHFEQLASTTDMRYLEFNDFGKVFVKQTDIHPDFFMQMALQLAYIRLHKKPCATYETGSTRLFYHGRTETVRSCTPEVVKWVKAMLDPNETRTTRLALLKDAVKAHADWMKAASLGEGVDRHLMGLQIIAGAMGLKTPQIYEHESYKLSGAGGNYVLSTSTVGFTPAIGGFSPMVKHGYGACYSIEDDRFNCCISAWKGPYGTNAAELRAALTQSLRDLQSLFLSGGRL